LNEVEQASEVAEKLLAGETACPTQTYKLLI
jgi:hypothetical protein